MFIMPDWQARMTKAEAEKELTGFKWNGPGLYHTENGDSLIAVDTHCLFGLYVIDRRERGDSEPLAPCNVCGHWTTEFCMKCKRAICHLPQRK